MKRTLSALVLLLGCSGCGDEGTFRVTDVEGDWLVSASRSSADEHCPDAYSDIIEAQLGHPDVWSVLYTHRCEQLGHAEAWSVLDARGCDLLVNTASGHGYTVPYEPGFCMQEHAVGERSLSLQVELTVDVQRAGLPDIKIQALGTLKSSGADLDTLRSGATPLEVVVEAEVDGVLRPVCHEGWDASATRL